MNIENKDLYLITSVLMVIGTMFLIYYYFTVECFTNAKILVDDIKSQDEYRKCINENSLVEQRTNGKINGCNALLAKFSSNNNSVNNKTPYGKLSELCPISTFSKMPSDCLEHRVANQTQTMDLLNNEINNFKKATLLQKMNIDSGSDEHKKHLDNIYANKEILDAVKYVNKNRFRVDNEEHNQIFDEKKNIKPIFTPVKTSPPMPVALPKNTPPTTKISKSIN